MRKAIMNTRKIFAIIMAVVMCFSMLSVTAFAEDNTSIYNLFVGGVAVNDDNLDDILGDGTASYNPDTNELYLDGLDITEGYAMDEYTNVGILAGQDLNIVLADGSDSIITTPANELTYGIGVAGSLYITGDGTLYVSCEAVNGEYDDADSYGIIATNGVCVEGASVYIRGGDINVTYWAQSSGIYTYGDVSVDFDGTLIAEGGNVTADVAYSDGITAYARGGIIYDADDENATQYINISVYDGYLEAEGGDVTGESHAMSTGIYGNFTGVYTYDASSVLVVKGGNATVPAEDNGIEPEAETIGICIFGGDVGIYAGDATVTTGNPVGFMAFATGIYVAAFEEEDGSFSGGYVSVYCDEVTPGEYSPGLVGTKLNVSAPDGLAIMAQMGVEIGENLAITNPENATVSECDDVYDYVCYTVLNEDGSIAEDVTIEPLGYRVTINGLNNGMVAEVPAGVSLNEFYCDFFGIEDFSEVLNLEKEGYTFAGFYTDEEFTNEFSFDDEINGDITIYAKWVVNENDNQQGGTTPDNNQNTDKDENKQPVADPEIPNTDANSNVWFVWLLTSAFGLFAVAVSNKKKVFLK